MCPKTEGKSIARGVQGKQLGGEISEETSLVHGRGTVFSSCPQRQDRGYAGDGPLLILLVDYQAIRVSNEVHALENLERAVPVDVAMPVVNLIQNHMFVPPEKFAERNDLPAQRGAWLADRHEIAQILIPET